MRLITVKATKMQPMLRIFLTQLWSMQQRVLKMIIRQRHHQKIVISHYFIVQLRFTHHFHNYTVRFNEILRRSARRNKSQPIQLLSSSSSENPVLTVSSSPSKQSPRTMKKRRKKRTNSSVPVQLQFDCFACSITFVLMFV